MVTNMCVKEILHEKDEVVRDIRRLHVTIGIKLRGGSVEGGHNWRKGVLNTEKNNKTDLGTV